MIEKVQLGYISCVSQFQLTLYCIFSYITVCVQ